MSNCMSVVAAQSGSSSKGVMKASYQDLRDQSGTAPPMHRQANSTPRRVMLAQLLLRRSHEQSQRSAVRVSRQYSRIDRD
jgi:hypothetical protein